MLLTKTRVIIAISSLLISPIALAITADELATQFESYKKQQAIALKKISQENEALKQQNQELKNKIENTRQQVTNNTTAVETVSENMAVSSGVEQWFNKTTFGAYGELHYNNRSLANSTHQERADFHRFVIFLGHEFTNNLRFYSELEVEHAVVADDTSGEVELEQAYLEYDFSDKISAIAGLFLMPVGIMNETHEPTSFYGVERNEVETRIIPTTWREGGIGATYRTDNGLSFTAAVTTGLEVKNDYDIRSGRGELSKQQANDPIIVARVKYTGIPNLELAGTVLHQTDLGQSNNTGVAVNFDIGSGTLFETHAIYSHAIGSGVLTTKALYSRWHINGNVNQAAKRQYGWYLEPSYKLSTAYGDVGVFGRYQKLDYYSGKDKNYNIWEAGANWWIHENVILKASYVYKQNTLNNNKDERGFDLGIGYNF